MVYGRLYSFLTRGKVLYERQYGFIPMMSTIDAITDLTADVLPSLDKREQCIDVYLDLSKVFHTINHGILLKNMMVSEGRSWSGLKVIYTREASVWHTKVYNLKLNILDIVYLRDRLFIMYSNDLIHSLQYCKAILVADHTTVYFTRSNLQIL